MINLILTLENSLKIAKNLPQVKHVYTNLKAGFRLTIVLNSLSSLSEHNRVTGVTGELFI